MRGNWEGAAETFVLAPSQQQQQQNMMETHQRHHPYQLPATPGWGMPHKLVKTEPMEENNTNLSSENYAGTSCSPGSRRSSGTGSLSPGSATSQDSNAMTSVNFDYSTQRLFTNQQSPLQFPRINMSDQTTAKNDHEPMDLGVHRSSEERDVEQDDFSCRTPPPFPSTNTMQNEDNYLSVKCDSQNNYSSELLEKSHDQLSPQLSPMDSRQLTSSPERSEHEYDNQKLLSSNISSSPRKNSHGKTKGYRCKECNFSTTTKQSLWKHAATHLKPKEKQLQCPYCPFITRYKHHFDYHISSHTGVKPYKCKECDYSCVNKSMLTSHAKSHLDIHQYRCADCSYETKYCHTLKKHLQKQGHKPQVVLNPDGTPNLSIIIDVHSTRRGPKQKPITKKIDAVKIDDNESPVFTATGPSPPPPPTTTTTTTTTLAPTTQLNSALPPPQLSPASYYPGVNPMAMINAFGNQLNPLMALQLNQCFSSGFPIANNFPMINDEFAEKQIENLKNNILFSEYAKTVASGFDNNQQKIETMVKENNNELVSDKSGKGPLDLSKLEDFSGSNDNNEDGVNQGFNNLADNFIGNQTTGINQFDKPSGTRKRKGKAVKLNVNNHSGVEEVDNQIAPTSTTISSTSSSSSASSSAASTPESKDKNEDNNKIEPVENEFKCKFCEISFGNEIMYSIHMGYHGFNDPYTCNSCGIKCDDKVSFYLHIHRSKHT